LAVWRSLLTLSGLFSLLSYVVEQRARDIGLRMALGATTRHVVESVLSQSLRPVVVGLVAGLLLAAALAAALMTTPAAAAIRDVVRVFDPVAYAATLLIIATSCLLSVLAPTMRAAQLNPIATLRRD
jgi:ABC-type lipoprotein release transport system permease subunit